MKTTLNSANRAAPTPARPGRRFVSARLILLVAACLPALGATCSGLGYLFGPLPAAGGSSATSLDLAVAVALPSEPTTAAPGAATVIQWADIATMAGTVVRVTAQRQNDLEENVGDPIHLIGDGTPGSGRDALADGDADVFEWDITGVRVGDYVITVMLEAPDGTTATAVSRDTDRNTTGVLTVTTALPEPTLAFTAPGDADVNVATGTPFAITWTDNGTANADAVLMLGLDTDADHESGNEIVLLRDQLLSESNDGGQFTFSFVDENGDTVPDGTYTVFATLDDNANDVVTVEATGHLILNP